MGYKVGLLDTDIFGPSMPKMFGVESERPYAVEKDGRQLIEPIEKYGVKLLSIGFFVNPDTATLWRGGMATSALKQLIADADWGDLDYFILDTPPGTSDIHLTLLQTLSITGAVIVSTPQNVALADARKGIDMYRNDKVNVPILGLVENMAWFTPAELPENRYYIFGKEGCKQLAKEMGCPLLAQIPLVQSICDNGDAGTPAVLNTESHQQEVIYTPIQYDNPCLSIRWMPETGIVISALPQLSFLTRLLAAYCLLGLLLEHFEAFVGVGVGVDYLQTIDHAGGKEVYGHLNPQCHIFGGDVVERASHAVEREEAPHAEG